MENNDGGFSGRAFFTRRLNNHKAEHQGFEEQDVITVGSGNVTGTTTDLLSTTHDQHHEQQQLINTQFSYRDHSPMKLGDTSLKSVTRQYNITWTTTVDNHNHHTPHIN